MKIKLKIVFYYSFQLFFYIISSDIIEIPSPPSNLNYYAPVY